MFWFGFWNKKCLRSYNCFQVLVVVLVVAGDQMVQEWALAIDIPANNLDCLQMVDLAHLEPVRVQQLIPLVLVLVKLDESYLRCDRKVADRQQYQLFAETIYWWPGGGRF